MRLAAGVTAITAELRAQRSAWKRLSKELPDTTGAAPDIDALAEAAAGSATTVGFSGGRAVATAVAGAGFAAGTGVALAALDGDFAAALGAGAGVDVDVDVDLAVAVAVVSSPPMPTFLAMLLKKPPEEPDDAVATRVAASAAGAVVAEVSSAFENIEAPNDGDAVAMAVAFGGLTCGGMVPGARA